MVSLLCLFVILVSSPVGFEGEIWVLIVQVPGHCIHFIVYRNPGGSSGQNIVTILNDSETCITCSNVELSKRLFRFVHDETTNLLTNY